MKTKEEKTLELLHSLAEPERSDLIKAIREHLASLPLHPHNRLGYPSSIKGQDVHVPTMTVDATLDLHRRSKIS